MHILGKKFHIEKYQKSYKCLHIGSSDRLKFCKDSGILSLRYG